MQNNQDKRQYQRTHINIPIRIELDDQKHANAIAVNIGQGGMLIKSVSGAAIAKLDDVELHLPLNHKQNNFIITAKVIRINGDHIGLFFYSNPAEYLQELLN